MSTKHIDISVVTPVYGVEKYIKNSLHSLFSQTKTEGVEFILVNDCTPDRSIEIAKEVIACYPMLDIKIVEHKKNGGVAAARQTGIDAAHGVYVIHFDPDDLCEPTMLEELYTVAEQYNIDIIVCDYYLVKPHKEIYVSQKIEDDPNKLLQSLLWLEIGGFLCNKFIRRSLYVDNNITFSKGINYQEDLLICAKLFPFAKKVKYINKAYYYYMQNENSITSKIKESHIINMIDLTREIEQFYSSRNIYSKIEKAILYKKNDIRIAAINNLCGREQFRYANIFPEAKAYIMKISRIPYYRRLLILLASYKVLFPYNILRFYTTYRDNKRKKKRANFNK